LAWLRLRLTVSTCIDDTNGIACFGLLASLVLADGQIATSNHKVL